VYTIEGTKQELFNKVVGHLAQQKRRSATHRLGVADMCCYRAMIGDATLKCAVGCLIPDEHYKPEMEGSSVYSLLEYGIFFPDQGIKNFLLELQGAHDSSLTAEQLRARLHVIAAQHKLSAWKVRSITEWST
jgi:hypothetical protein